MKLILIIFFLHMENSNNIIYFSVYLYIVAIP